MLTDVLLGSLSEPVSGRSWKPDEIRREIAARMAGYQARGLKPGDRVLIHFGNQLEFFADLLAIWSLGGCAIPVDTRLTAYEVGKLIEASRARFHVISEQTPSGSLDTASDIHVIKTCENRADDVVPAISRLPRLDDEALILFTSGSTGEPKGVVHTHRSLRARWTTLQQSLGLDCYRRTLCLLPTHFGHGLICNCLFPWLAGCDLYLTPPFKPELIMRLGALIDEHRITFMSSVPSVWNLALKAASPPAQASIRRIHVGSAPLSAAMWKSVQQWAGTEEVFNAYGITETGSWVAGTTGGPFEPADGLVGYGWGATIRILKARQTGEAITANAECGPGEEGMIWLNTPALMKEYFRRPDLTDAVVDQGWFMTGDIGLLDDRGRLVIRGRERDEINKGGMKVFPADIDAIVEQLSEVRDVCTFGFADEQYGENVGMAIVVEDASHEVLLRLQTWIDAHLAEHKKPLRWYLLDEIPRTSRGKINRADVRTACEPLEPLDLRQLLADRK